MCFLFRHFRFLGPISAFLVPGDKEHGSGRIQAEAALSLQRRGGAGQGPPPGNSSTVVVVVGD